MRGAPDRCGANERGAKPLIDACKQERPKEKADPESNDYYRLDLAKVASDRVRREISRQRDRDGDQGRDTRADEHKEAEEAGGDQPELTSEWEHEIDHCGRRNSDYESSTGRARKLERAALVLQRERYSEDCRQSKRVRLGRCGCPCREQGKAFYAQDEYGHEPGPEDSLPVMVER
jgi:hypothetical protein